DIPEIARHFTAFYCQKYGKTLKQLPAETLDALVRYPWPGNVRALRHAIERAVILSDEERLSVADFQLHDRRASQAAEGEGIAILEDLAGAADLNLERLEYRAIVQALRRNRYVISHAASELGLTRAALYRRMEKHGL